MLKWRILLPTNLARNTNQRSTAASCLCLSSVFEGKSATLIHFQSSSKKIAALLRHHTTRNLLVRSVVIYVVICVAGMLTVMLRRV